ncbi:LAFE_0D07470g1_1 [Lachancea fermentati]|uniref:LAFE_0D07470g1_1 n=1 Tax=Lachancea fermentati TaxID=4955 RepID=A0A1G4MBD2_LACFM|nr:LAFE_0D07470g1_1 [Lachancea fermentati]
MSSRVLRKLGNDDLEATLAKLTQKNNEDVEPRASPLKKAQNVNFFALMNDDDDEQEQSDESENLGVESQPESIKDSQSHLEKPSPVLLPSKSQKKKNKKKRKSKQKPTPKNYNSEQDDRESDEELSLLIKQFQKKDFEKSGLTDRAISENSDSEYDTAHEEDYNQEKRGYDIRYDPGFTRYKSYNEILAIFGELDMKSLNPDNEFKLLFDDISAEALADVDSMTSTHVSPQVLKQLERMKRLVRNWGGKDHRSVPNGSAVRRLAFTKIRDDWLPTTRGELVMKALSSEDIENWLCWMRPQDWRDEIKKTTNKWLSKGFEFFKFEPLSSEISRKEMTEFYMSVVLHPDHEALINLISSKYPYHVPSLLQVALILVRQGDKTNSNGLVERALFVFDRALRANITFNGKSCQLPYIFFFNRQFYLSIFRYIQIISQRGAISTASCWCKVLWSLSPLEDPLGCRYFLDHFLLINEEYTFLLKTAKSPLVTTYTQWYTLGLSLGSVLSYLRLDSINEARNELRKCFQYHAAALKRIFIEVTAGDQNSLGKLLKLAENNTNTLESKAYILRMKTLWGVSDLKFFHDEMVPIIKEYNSGSLQIEIQEEVSLDNNFFIQGIPVNLLRFAILSQESPVMACIPESIWSTHDVYEFDVLPPVPTDKESMEVVETIKTHISEEDLSIHQLEMMQDETILNQIRQLSLEQFMQENPNAGIEE